ncbi:MAG: type II toxin-antitoxin system RelE/ParE family toxin [Burkholderiaceae bacterium]
MRSGVKVLVLQPGMGRPSHDMDAVFREWVIDFGNSGYVVKYHFNGTDVTILAVRHQLEAGYLPD